MKSKNTIATTFRGDIKSIAALANFWHKQGYEITSINKVLTLSIDALTELIINKYPKQEITNIEDAIKVLEHFNIFNIEKKFRNKKTLLNELSLENIEREPEHIITKQSNSPFGSDQAQNKTNEELNKQIMKKD